MDKDFSPTFNGWTGRRGSFIGCAHDTRARCPLVQLYPCDGSTTSKAVCLRHCPEHVLLDAMRTWYVTYELNKRGLLKRRRHPRATRTFETEMEAKHFAREKLDEGLIVFAGTINPTSPRQLIPSTDISSWIENAQKPAVSPHE